MTNRLQITWLPWTVAALISSMQPATSFADTDVAAGRALFIAKGCYECHGVSGQGSISTGPTLAPYPIALAAMEQYVHTPKRQMPPFSRKFFRTMTSRRCTLTSIRFRTTRPRAAPRGAAHTRRFSLLEPGHRSPRRDALRLHPTLLHMGSRNKCPRPRNTTLTRSPTGRASKLFHPC